MDKKWPLKWALLWQSFSWNHWLEEIHSQLFYFIKMSTGRNKIRLYFIMRGLESLLETSGEHPVHFLLLPVYEAMNHSETPLWLMLRPPSFYQGADCLARFSRFNNTWRQRPNQRLPYNLVDRLYFRCTRH